MGRKDSRKSGAGGVRSAGTVVSAPPAPQVAVPMAANAPRRLKDASESLVSERPTPPKPRYSSFPRDLHPLKGLIAPNFIKTGLFLRADLLDLLDSASWRHFRTRNFEDLRGAAVCAMIVCCGATMAELCRIQCSDWLPKLRDEKTGEEKVREEVELSGIEQKRLARPMPVMAFAKMVIDRYDRAVTRAPGVTHLFVDGNGQPASYATLFAQLKWMTVSNGFPVDSLAMALVNAFDKRAKKAGDAMARALTRETMRKWQKPDPKISIPEMREALENVHPLGRLDREMLLWRGPHARRYPDPHFPALSREGRTEYEAALKKCGGTTFGTEVRDAVRVALASGKLVGEVADHYGMNISYVQDVRDGKIEERPRKLSSRPLQLALLKRMRSDPPPTAAEARAWALQNQGIELSTDVISAFARTNDVVLARAPQFKLHGHEEALLSRMRHDPPPSAAEIVVWAKEECGLDLHTELIYRLAWRKGVVLGPSSQFKLHGHEEKLLSKMRQKPPPSAREMVAWASRELGLELRLHTIYRFAKRKGVKLSRSANRPSGG